MFNRLPKDHPWSDLFAGDVDNGAIMAISELFERYPELVERCRARRVRFCIFYVSPPSDYGFTEPSAEDVELMNQKTRRAIASTPVKPGAGTTDIYVAVTGRLASRQLIKMELGLPGLFAGSLDVGEGGAIFFAADGTVIGSEKWEQGRDWLAAYLQKLPAR